MKLRTIYIKNFGKLKDFKLKLKPELNIICGNNESGKTTVMSFIKMMFYGTSCKSSDIGKNLRKKYAPWDGSPMSGYIEFEASGQEYRLEREFGNSNISDVITIWNLTAGKAEPPSCKYEPGERFMGMNASTFERSVFIGDITSVIHGTDKEDEITRKLMNYSSSAEESISYETVRKRLQKAHDELRSKGRKPGEIDTLTAELSDLTERLSAAEDEEKLRMNDEEIHASYCSMLENKKEHAAELEKRIKEQRIIRELHTLEVQSRKNAVKAVLEEKISSLTASITNGDFTVDDSFLDECSDLLSKLDHLKENYREKKNEFNQMSADISEMKLGDSIEEFEADLDLVNEELKAGENEIEGLKNEIAAIDSARDEVNDLIRETQIKEELYKEHLADMEPNYLVLIPAAAMIIIAISLFIKNAWFLLAIIPVVLMIFLGTKLTAKIEEIRDKKAGIEHKEPDYEEAYRSYDEKLSEFELKSSELTDKVNLLGTKIAETALKKTEIEQKTGKLKLIKEQKDSELNRLGNELNKTGKDINELDIHITDIFSKFKPVSTTAEIPELIDKAVETISEIETTKAVLSSKHDEDDVPYSPEEITERSALLREKLSQLTGGNGPELLSDSYTDALEEELEETEVEINSLKDTIATLRSGISAKYHASDEPSLLREKIDVIKEQIRERLKYVNELNIASEIMEEAGNEIRQTFAPELNSKTEKIFAHLTGGKYKGAIVSKDLAVTPVESHDKALRDWQYLSTGTAEQAYLSLRLALSDMMAGNKIPVFLDDVFAHYDEERTRKGFLFLSEYSRLDQVIFFTCHRYSLTEDHCITFPEQ
ncbi:MAG: AAA family ATPase [Oscillospiraceae bacterium]|nr:AAA family ATPase [Oscillospiraceae bacterium]MBR3536147.1 AAA family ATPase [Oscillospiraceae bacterium]